MEHKKMNDDHGGCPVTSVKTACDSCPEVEQCNYECDMGEPCPLDVEDEVILGARRMLQETVGYFLLSQEFLTEEQKEEYDETIKSLICQACAHKQAGICDGVTPNLVPGDCPRDEYERTGDI